MIYYELNYSGHIPALKNNRQGFNFKAKKGKTSWIEAEVRQLVYAAQRNPPSKEVIIAMTSMEQSFRRQMTRNEWRLIEKPQFVYCLYEIGVYYVDYPKSDIDNMVTTIQEVLPNAGVIENDVQVRSGTPIPYKVATKDSEYCVVRIFPIGKDEPTLRLINDIHNFVLDEVTI